MLFSNRFLLVAVIVLASGCASTQEMADEPSSPFVGSWEYVIDSPEGQFTGYLMITEDETGLKAFVSEGDSEIEGSIEVDSVEFDQEMQLLSFSFDNPDYGRMNVSLTLEEQEMNGILHVVQFSLDVPMVVTRSEQ